MMASFYGSSLLSSYAMAKDELSDCFESDFRIDVLELWELLLAGTLSYLEEGRLPADMEERTQTILNHLRTLNMKQPLSNPSIRVQFHTRNISTISLWIVCVTQ